MTGRVLSLLATGAADAVMVGRASQATNSSNEHAARKICFISLPCLPMGTARRHRIYFQTWVGIVGMAFSIICYGHFHDVTLVEMNSKNTEVPPQARSFLLLATGAADAVTVGGASQATTSSKDRRRHSAKNRALALLIIFSRHRRQQHAVFTTVDLTEAQITCKIVAAIWLAPFCNHRWYFLATCSIGIR